LEKEGRIKQTIDRLENAKVDNAIRRTLICQGDENKPIAKLSKLLVLNVCQSALKRISGAARNKRIYPPIH